MVVDERTPGYLRTACDYVHLNPVRAGLVQVDAPLSAYPWSSFPLYVSVRRRPPWLRVDRLLGEHGIQEDSAKGRIEFRRRMERERRETDTERADQIVQHGLQEVGWSEADLARHPKGHPHKITLAHKLRHETPMTRGWIAKRLHIGSASYVSHLLARP